MSNAEKMVMVPRELIERIARAGCWPDDEKALRQIMDQPAQQHQGEPVGYVCGAALDAALNGRIGAESIAIRKEPSGYINKPLYAHADRADRAEVENAYDEAIIASNELGYAGMCAADVIRHQADEFAGMRSKLAEAQELLRMFAENSDDADVVQLSNQHLSDSAEPSAPKCKCDMRTKLVGDGCAKCNPERAAELMDCYILKSGRNDLKDGVHTACIDAQSCISEPEAAITDANGRVLWQGTKDDLLIIKSAVSGSAEPSAPVEFDERAEVTIQNVLVAFNYAEDHPHRYLRGTTNWAAALAHSLNRQARAALARKP